VWRFYNFPPEEQINIDFPNKFSFLEKFRKIWFKLLIKVKKRVQSSSLKQEAVFILDIF